jgi:glyoxylase I family protein
MSFQRRELLQILPYAVASSFLLSANESAMAVDGTTQSASPASPVKTPAPQQSAGTEPEKVTGIGGLFFRAHDPKALGLWYQKNLGITLEPSSAGGSVWQQEAGPTVFSPFPETTKYFGDPQKMWMVNFRVRNLDKMVAQLQAAGIEVKVYPPDATGHFAHLHDPEGNPIELWQPAK